MAKVPIKTVEPLITTMGGYCKAFDALCTFSCQERMQEQSQNDRDKVDEDEVDKDKNGEEEEEDDDDEEEEDKDVAADSVDKDKKEQTNGCSNTDARSVLQAKATCQCAGLDMTDRINFAIVGGIVSSRKSSSPDGFSAEAASDGLVILSSNPTFQTVMTVASNVCTYVDRLNAMTNPQAHKPPAPSGGGGVFGFISSLIPGMGTAQDLLPLVPIINGLLGNGDYGIRTEVPKTNEEKPITVPHAPSSPSSPPTGPSPQPPTSTDSDSASKSKGSDGGIFGWLPHIFGDKDGHRKIVEQSVNGKEQDDDNGNEEGDEQSQLVDEDGRIAKITRMQRRHTKKPKANKTSNEQKQDDKDDL
ncbi:hypothetical protein BGX26_008105 [Mortierella sp. AD094]|nr:hypothetical protein BGX26_008105 [Mortierella sp. AD094]